MRKLEIYLKSGHTIELECEKWEFIRDNTTTEYTGYEITKPNKAFGIVVGQIAGYKEIE